MAGMNQALVLLAGLSLAAPIHQETEGGPDPEMRGVILREEGASDGYTLFAPLRSSAMRLIDLDGNVVHTWHDADSGYSVLLENGHLLGLAYAPEKNPRFHGPGVSGGLLRELDWDGSVVWSHLINDEHQQVHHDVDVMPNGNLLCVVREYISREEAIESGRDPERVDEEGMWPDAIYEIRPARDGGETEVVWEWHAWDHLIQDHDETKSNFGSIQENPGRVDINVDHRDQERMTEEELEELRELEKQMAALGYGGEDEEAEEDEEDEYPLGTAPDWLHVNAVTLHPELDLIVLSVPNLNELWVIDHSTTTEQAASSAGGRWGRGGEILWRWGSPRNYGAGEDSDTQLFFQHDPTWVPGERPGELRLLVFNNGGDDPERDFSTVDELVLPFDPESGFRRGSGRPFGPAKPAWTYRLPADCTSSFISGARRLPSGNVLVCAGAPGRLLEVTREGRLVWDYENPFSRSRDLQTDNPDAPPSNAVYRAVPVPAGPPRPGGAGICSRIGRRRVVHSPIGGSGAPANP